MVNDPRIIKLVVSLLTDGYVDITVNSDKIVVPYGEGFEELYETISGHFDDLLTNYQLTFSFQHGVSDDCKSVVFYLVE